MASKSRLGKGLGALFPALPGENSEVAKDDKPKSDSDSNKSVKAPAKKAAGTTGAKTRSAAGKKSNAAVSQKSASKSVEGVEENVIVSRETMTKSEAKTPAAEKNSVPDKVGKIVPDDAGNSVSANETEARVSAPSVIPASSTGISNANVSRETDRTDKSEAATPEKESGASAPVIGSVKQVTGDSSKAESEKTVSSTTSSTSKSLKNKNVGTLSTTSANVSRETSANSRRKRMSIPAMDGLGHPSDLFFGGDVAGNVPSSSRGAGIGEQSSQNGASAGKGVSATSSTADEVNVNTTDGAVADLATGLKPVQGGYLVELELDQIGPNANQPRTIFDEDELQELASSLREVGVLQPVVVRKRPEDQRKAAAEDAKHADSSAQHEEKQNSLGASSNTSVFNMMRKPALSDPGMSSEYELIMGERRWRAAHLAGLKTIPAIVKTTTDNHMLRDALLENLHRVALNPLEEAAAYQQMMSDFGLTQEQLSKSVSRSRPQIANTLRLLNLPLSVQKKVGSGVLSAGHARALLGLQTEEEMSKLANRVLAEGLSVRSTEEIVALQSANAEPVKKEPPKRKNPWSESPIQHNLENRFDTKVSIKGSKKRGRIEIVFSSPEDMDRILNILMPDDKSGSSSWV